MLKLITNLLIILAVVAGGGSLCAASSQSIDRVKGITLMPVRSELEIDSGAAYHGELTVTNDSNHPASIKLSAAQFTVINEDYDYSFKDSSDEVKWVLFEDPAFILQPGETKKCKYAVSVPLGAEPGGRYISLFVSVPLHI